MDTFAEIFRTLYNSSESNTEMDELQNKLKELVATEYRRARWQR